jgi:hypothetical protein
MNRATTFRHSRKLHQTVGYVTYTSDDTPKPKNAAETHKQRDSAVRAAVTSG